MILSSQQLNATCNYFSLKKKKIVMIDTTMAWLAQFYLCFVLFCCCLLACFDVGSYYMGLAVSELILLLKLALNSHLWSSCFGPQHAGITGMRHHVQNCILYFKKGLFGAGDMSNDRVLVYHAQAWAEPQHLKSCVERGLLKEFLYACPNLTDQNKMALDSNESCSFTT